jgi:Tfp pilus assembly protein PilV
MRYDRNNSAGPVGLKGRESGMSLIEAIVAIAIIAVGVVALVAQLEASYRITSVNRETNKAVAHLQASLEKVIATPFASITTAFPNRSAVTLDNIDSPDVLDQEVITVSYADVSADPLEITVTIQWKAFDGRVRTRALSTLRTR